MALFHFIFLGAIIAVAAGKTIPASNSFEYKNVKSNKERYSINDPLFDEFIDTINNLNTTWKAGSSLPNITISCIHSMPGPVSYTGSHILPQLRTGPLNFTLPEKFDSRVQWPNCTTIREIRNQGCCGSSWAVAAAEVMSDRLCIQSHGRKNVHISAEDLLSCCSTGRNGCRSGDFNAAWSYWLNNGIVSGGNYGSKQGCRPYTIAPCKNGTKPESTVVPKCIQKCQSRYKGDYKSELQYAKLAYYGVNGEEAMKQEIYQYGPIEGILIVYEDFQVYKSGVYQHVKGKKLQSHAVKIIGWGVERGRLNTSYWLAANSWGTEWGDKGFFKIRRGVNEANIEKVFYAGIPRIWNDE